MSVLLLYSRYIKRINKLVETLPTRKTRSLDRIRDLRHATSLQVNINIVIPAQAGIHTLINTVIPAKAGIYLPKVVIPAKAGILFLILIISLFFFTACDNAGEPILPEPGDVKMVEHFAGDDILAIERGIDAVPESDGIYLAWYSLRDNNISHYNIYRKKESGTFYQRIKTIDLETASPGRDTTFVDDNAEAGLELNTYYYYYITATNTEGQESSSVDTLRYMLINKPDLLKSDKDDPYDPDVDGLPILFWHFVETPDLYILRIENIYDQLLYVHIFQVIDYSRDKTLDLNDEEKVPDLPDFPPGFYKWRIDSVGPDEDHSGSESNWALFSII